MRINATRYVILGLLSEEPMTGYDIKKMVDLRFRYFWNESYGQIYPELKKLTEEGLAEPVEPEKGQSESGRPKKFYGITDSGKESFSEWMNITPEYEKQRFEFLLKIYWAQWLPTERVGEYIRDFIVYGYKQESTGDILFAHLKHTNGENNAQKDCHPGAESWII